MPRTYLSLGSNLEPEDNLRLAVRELADRFGILRLSPVYRNKAVGFDGDDFLNMVVGMDTEQGLEAVVQHIDAIHDLAGRIRGGERFSSRTLDIDVLLYGSRIANGKPLVLPRKDVLEYAFVLKPLADIAGDERHPVTGRRYASHWDDMQPTADAMTRVRLDF